MSMNSTRRLGGEYYGRKSCILMQLTCQLNVSGVKLDVDLNKSTSTTRHACIAVRITTLPDQACLSTMQRLPDPGGTSSRRATLLTALVKAALCSAVRSCALNLAVTSLSGMGPAALRNATTSCSDTPPGASAAAGAAAAGAGCSTVLACA